MKEQKEISGQIKIQIEVGPLGFVTLIVFLTTTLIVVSLILGAS